MQPQEMTAWWRRARPVFERLIPNIILQIDNEASRLERLLARKDETVLCFLGQSGIGKSTLINAIVAGPKNVLPAGGTGPLTAIATQVCYSERPYFRIRYQSPEKLRGLLLNLENLVGRQSQPRVAGTVDSPSQAPSIKDPALFEAPGQADPEDGEASGFVVEAGTPSERMEGLIRATQMLVIGAIEVPANLPRLIAGLRCALGRRYDGQIEDSDRERLSDIAEALTFAKTGSMRAVTDNGTDDTFAKLLNKHTAGSLAPLVSEIEVGWPSEILRGGVVLVDLPGVGIAGDDYQRATHAYVRQRARGIVMVVSRGVTRDEIELMRTSGFWERALLAAGDPETDPCDLLVARTKVDEVVVSALSERELDNEQFAVLYQDVMREAENDVRSQTVTELGRLSGIETDDQDIRQSRERAAKHVLEGLTVHPVSAADYQKLLGRNSRLPALAPSPEETGIPSLRRRLEQLGRRNSAALRGLRESSMNRLGEIASAAIDQELAGLADGRREKEELDRLRADLARFLEPLRVEYAVRQGQYHEFLDRTAGVLIDGLVGRAQANARKGVVGYLEELGSASWATLRAAVVRGGAFNGKRKIDLADDIAQLFQEPVAAIWGSRSGLLREVRARTADFGDITRTTISQVLDWSNARPGDIISQDGMEATKRAVDALVGQLGQVGKDAVDELRRAVRDRLLDATTPAIKLACDRFVQRGDAAGRGVKMRMGAMFADLAEESMSRAADVARQLLNERFAEVRRDISDVFAQWGDPLTRIADAIAPAEYSGDAKRRAEDVAKLEAI